MTFVCFADGWSSSWSTSKRWKRSLRVAGGTTTHVWHLIRFCTIRAPAFATTGQNMTVGTRPCHGCCCSSPPPHALLYERPGSFLLLLHSRSLQPRPVSNGTMTIGCNLDWDWHISDSVYLKFRILSTDSGKIQKISFGIQKTLGGWTPSHHLLTFTSSTILVILIVKTSRKSKKLRIIHSNFAEALKTSGSSRKKEV